MNLKGNDFLKLLDYTPEQIDYLLRLAAQLKAEGARNKDIAKTLAAEFGLPRNAAYEIALEA